MGFRIVEVDGVQVDPTTGKFPVEVHPEVHAINGVEHTGVLDDSQIPQEIMRDTEHQNDPHTMIIDGRDVSADGAKLDTIEQGAEVNNLTDQQASSLIGGSHSSWHHHDNWYYRKTDLQTSGTSTVHWDNITNTPSEWNPSAHNHDNLYYTQTQLDPSASQGSNVLDARYYTEDETAQLYYSKNDLNSGQLDDRYYTEIEIDDTLTNYFTKTQLLGGSIDSRYYTESEIDTFLADKANKVHNHDSVYYTQTQLSISGTVGSNVLDDRYFTEGEITTNHYTKTEVDSLVAAASYGISGAVNLFSELPSVADVGIVYIVRQEEGTSKEGFYRWDGTEWIWLAHNLGGIHHNDLLGLNNGDYKHLTANQLTALTTGVNATSLHIHDDRYYTETEVDGFLSDYYNKTELNSGQLDNRYYTETEIDDTFSLYYTITQLDNGQLDNRYFTETEIATNYYSKTELDTGQLDNRYYTETEVDTTISNYYSKIDLDDGQLDNRYYTETEVDGKLSLYFTKTELLNGSIDDRYFTESELANGVLDSRYYTESEIDSLIAAAAYGITGSVDTVSDLPSVIDPGIIYIVKQDSVDGDEGFYQWDGTQWNFLAHNTGETLHNNLSGLNDGDYKHLTATQYSSLTGSGSATSLHIHDDRYYTEIEVDGFLSNKSDIGHNHNDLYYTEAEVDGFLTSYYTKNELDGGSLDSRYYTETELDPTVTQGSNVLDARYYTKNEITTNYYTKSELNNGELNTLYYTRNEIDSMTALYYTKTSLDNGSLDGRYYTETEVDGMLNNYYTINQLENGSLDGRYFTENEITLNYYSKNDLNSGSLDGRYYTETEVDNLISAIEVFGIKGGVDTFADLPASPIEGDIYIVRQDSIDGEEGFYKWDGTTWIFLSNNTGATSHNDLNGLNSGDYLHLTSNEYSSLTEGVDTSLHTHDGRYYTETEIDNLLSDKTDIGHTHNDLYYTETEIDNLLSDKTDIGHAHDDRYYTETEVDNLLSQKSGLNHIHDDRYYTQSQISSNYYTKTQLNSGQLNNIYYTETEIDSFLASKSDVGHAHDDRYYTETEVDNTLVNYYTKNELDDGSLDSRYYTETELDVKFGNKSNVGHLHDDRYYTETELSDTGTTSGADRIGIRSITGLTSNNVQSAIEEINTNLGNSSSTLQEAYESDNVVNTDDTNGPVVLNGETTPALEISNQTTPPTQNVAAGSIAVINNKLYTYDGSRNKWLTPSKFLSFGRLQADGQYMSIHESSYYGTGYKMIENGTIITFSMKSVYAFSGKDVYILINDSIVKSLTVPSDGTILVNDLNIDFNAGDDIATYLGGSGGKFWGVSVNMEVCWRA